MRVSAHTSFVGNTGYNVHARNFFTELHKICEVKVRNYTVGKSWQGYSYAPHEGEKYLSATHKGMLGMQILHTEHGRQDFPIYGYSKYFHPNVHIVLNETDHYLFYDNYQGRKIAYNVWESTLYPQHFFDKLKEYDELWVPSKWQKQCAINQGYPEWKIRVVPEGVDANIFKPAERTRVGKFQFVMVGRWEYRKATTETITAWLELFRDNKDVELVLLVDNPFGDGLTTEERLKAEGLESDNITIRRNLLQEEYVELLQQADVYLSCSRAEGWNLPLIEAMACGIVCVYSNYSGQLEFAQGKGVPVPLMHEQATDGTFPGYYCEPDFSMLEVILEECVEKYDLWKSLALKESIEIREKFSWQNAAELAYAYLCNPARQKRVFVDIDSTPLGDTLAYMPAVEAHRQKHDCYVICSSHHNYLFRDTYPGIEFIEKGQEFHDVNQVFHLFWYGPKMEPMQKEAFDILGLPYVETKPLIPLTRPLKKKQVAIAIHATAQAKYWNNPEGWQQVVDFCKENGYEVLLLSREQDGFMGNHHPAGIQQLPDGPLYKVIHALEQSALFIGIGSGLSWLAWAAGTPSIVISGFSDPCTEPATVRIGAPENTCSGCFNKHRLQADDWEWCPEHKGTERQFECSKKIESITVINHIKNILKLEP